ncbi:MAG: hypothetical protein ISS78_11820 [Phycisphaerae bacterium]|nr:hypothetical protein [Phycisphaerae bacterium]
MTLGIRKLVVVGLVGTVLLLGNFILVANWLREKGVIDWAKDARKEYLTGTAITIIVVVLILLVSPRSAGRSFVRRCSVCDHAVLGRGSYCGECGSKLS